MATDGEEKSVTDELHEEAMKAQRDELDNRMHPLAHPPRDDEEPTEPDAVHVHAPPPSIVSR